MLLEDLIHIFPLHLGLARSSYVDRSFSFITKTPPASSLILEATGLKKGSSEPNKEKVGQITIKQIQDIAKIKLPDLITKTDAINFFFLDKVKGNYITDKSVHGKIKFYKTIKSLKEI